MRPPRDEAAAAAAPAFSTLGAVLCGGLLLLLFASTIVLALIPVYLPQKASNYNAQKSNLFQIYVNTGPSAGRKRQTSPVDSFIGGKFTNVGLASAQSQFYSIVKSNTNINAVTCTDGTIAEKTRRRRAISKRQTIYTTYISFTCQITFAPKCSSKTCQTKASSSAQSLLSSGISSSTLYLSNIPINKPDGTSWGTLTTVPIAGVIAVTSILPLSVSSATATPLTSVTSTTTTTTVAAV